MQKSKQIYGKKLKSSLKGKGLLRTNYLKKLNNKYSVCNKELCWHKLSSINILKSKKKYKTAKNKIKIEKKKIMNKIKTNNKNSNKKNMQV